MAPVLSTTAEFITDYSQQNKKESIHLQQFASLRELSDITHQPEITPIQYGYTYDFVMKLKR